MINNISDGDTPMKLEPSPRRWAALAATALALLAAPAAHADYPDKPITLIVPYSPGGMGSSFGNLVSEVLTPALGQHVIVDYRPGANGGLGATSVAKAPADGYTLLMAVNTTMAVNPNLYPKLGFDPVKDFAPVAVVYTNANILVVNPTSSFKSVADLLAYAKANPGKLSFGSAGNGSSTHLSGEMLKQMGHVDLVHVPYKGSAPAIVDLMGNQIGLVFTDTAVLPLIAAGKLRALAVTGPHRMPQLPEVPTLEEQGLKGFVITTWYSVAAPAGTPGPVIERLNRELTKAMQTPAVRARLKDFGVEPAEDMSSGYAEALIRSDLARWKKFIAETGIKVD
jgi:tripartite-type tricarboxylate transporter receptor subunit TctC